MGRFKIAEMAKGKELRIEYEVEYLKTDEDSNVVNNVVAKGSNTNKAVPKDNNRCKCKGKWNKRKPAKHITKSRKSKKKHDVYINSYNNNDASSNI